MTGVGAVMGGLAEPHGCQHDVLTAREPLVRTLHNDLFQRMLELEQGKCCERLLGQLHLLFISYWDYAKGESFQACRSLQPLRRSETKHA